MSEQTLLWVGLGFAVVAVVMTLELLFRKLFNGVTEKDTLVRR